MCFSTTTFYVFCLYINIYNVFCNRRGIHGTFPTFVNTLKKLQITQLLVAYQTIDRFEGSDSNP